MNSSFIGLLIVAIGITIMGIISYVWDFIEKKLKGDKQ